MKYLCLVYYDTGIDAYLGQSDRVAIKKASLPYDAALNATGKVVIQSSLSPPNKCMHIVPKYGKPSVKNGSYLPGNAQVGAFLIIDVADADEAVAVASKHAPANVDDQLGFAVEIRACENCEDNQIPTEDAPNAVVQPTAGSGG